MAGEGGQYVFIICFLLTGAVGPAYTGYGSLSLHDLRGTTEWDPGLEQRDH